MGIINATPDSFYAGSRKQALADIVDQAGKMLLEGADILDIGGQSTRPGAERVGAATEAERVVPAIAAVKEAYPDALISVDTFYASVAEAAVAAGACMVNDVSSGTFDEDLLPAVAALQVPYVCMHIKGTPQTMQQQPQYEDVTREVLDFLISKIAECRALGIGDIIADPGLGFGKTIAHNFTLLRAWEAFGVLGVPVLMGISRKRTIYQTLGIEPEQALNGTTVLHTVGLLKGTHLLRVHDVREAAEAVLLLQHLFPDAYGRDFFTP